MKPGFLYMQKQRNSETHTDVSRIVFAFLAHESEGNNFITNVAVMCLFDPPKHSDIV